MPSRPCHHPTCPNYVIPPNNYCADHQAGASPRAEQHRYYDQHLRDKRAKAFYNSKAWQLARAESLANHPWCARCRINWATTVHHSVPVASATAREKVDQRLLVPVCAACHSAIEAEIKANEQ